jgi:SOS-response transcriptional repressor LexA
MEPTLRSGDLLVVRWGAVPRVGDLVLVRLPDRPLSVKRAVRREPGGWWVERDNPREGVDSWAVGAIPDAEVLGTVVLRYWPRPALLRSGPLRSGPLRSGWPARRRAR